MENMNNINLKEEFLKMYVKEATHEQLQHINMLLKQGDYEQVNTIIEEYTHNIINNKDLKDFSSGIPVRPEFKEKFSTEDMDSQTFELYSILMLIDKYEKEQDEEKKKMLKNQIQMALNKYRNAEEIDHSRNL